MRRDWGSLGRRLCDVLARCEATGGFQPYVDALAALREACEAEMESVCGGPLAEFYPGTIPGHEPALQIPERVADHTSRGKF